MRRKGFAPIFIIGIIGVIILVLGTTVVIKQKGPVDKPLAQPIDKIPSPQVNSNLIPCDKVIDIKPVNATGTEDWETIDVCSVSSQFDTDLNGSYRYLPYTLKLPKDWSLGSVLQDENGIKVGEKPESYDISHSDCNFFVEKVNSPNISVNNILIGNLNVVKVVRGQVPTESINWYPHFYCIENGNKVFTFQFYKRDLSDNSHIIFEKILSTLNFPDNNNWYNL